MFAKEKDCFSASVLIALIGGLLSGYFFYTILGKILISSKQIQLNIGVFFIFRFEIGNTQAQQSYFFSSTGALSNRVLVAAERLS